MRRLVWLSVMATACVHKPPPHLAAEGGSGDGSGSGSALGSAELVEGELVLHWTIAAHVRTPHAALGDLDASALEGRIVELTKAGYTAPWQGTCEAATRTRADTTIAAVAAAQGIDAAKLTAFGFADPLTEVRSICTDALKAPPLTVWASADKLLTCAQGVCYLMNRTTDHASTPATPAVNH